MTAKFVASVVIAPSAPSGFRRVGRFHDVCRHAFLRAEGSLARLKMASLPVENQPEIAAGLSRINTRADANWQYGFFNTGGANDHQGTDPR